VICMVLASNLPAGSAAEVLQAPGVSWAETLHHHPLCMS